MAQSLVTTCDRCNAIIPGIHAVVETKSSADRRMVLTKFDMCDKCMEDFSEYMKAKLTDS